MVLDAVCSINTQTIETAIGEAINRCVVTDKIMYVYKYTNALGLSDHILLDKDYYYLLYVADPNIERQHKRRPM